MSATSAIVKLVQDEQVRAKRTEWSAKHVAADLEAWTARSYRCQEKADGANKARCLHD